MRSRIHGARLRTRPIWLMAAVTCFIPTLLISDASLQTADARMMMGERPAMGHASRMDGGRMHGGGHRTHGHRGGGFRGGGSVGLGLAIGGMVIDQIQRQQARDDDEPRDVPSRRYVDKPSSKTSTATSVSKPKKKDPPSVARKKNDEPVYAKKKGEPVYAKKQDTPYSSKKKDEPRSGGSDPRDVPVSRRGDPRDVPVAYGDPRDVPVANDDPRDEPVPTSTTTREPGLKPPPEYPTSRPPRTPVLVPPSTPLLVSNPTPEIPLAPPAARCEDCRELWLEIKRYEKQIADDEKKLAREEKKLKRREQERDELEAKIRKAKGPLKQELEKRLEKVKQSIKWLTEWNDELSDIIQEEKDVKASLEEAYNKCADPQCREKTADTPEAPKDPEPTPEQPKDTPVTSAPPPEVTPNPTPVVLTPGQPEPPPASTPASGPCVDHWAELTNVQRVFHRLYIQGAPRETFILGAIEQYSWNNQMTKMQSALEGPGRQDPNSTTQTLRQPSWKEMMEEFEKLQARAQPCEEVTIIVQAHGFFDKFDGGWEGSVQLNSNGDPLTSGRLAKVVKGFRPDVSVTVFMDSCEGGGFGGESGIEQTQLVQVIGNSETCPSLDAPFREELFEEFINGIDNAANGSRNGRTTAGDVKSHLVHSGWPIGSPLDY